MESATIWVCQCCMLTHACGECCDELYYGQDPDHDPLALVDNSQVTMGMHAGDHDETCEINITGSVPDGYECDCETNTYSTSQCEGCGSWLHGERHAMTLWFQG